MLTFLSTALGIGQTIASAAGSLSSMASADSSKGLAMAAAEEKATNYQMQRDQALFSSLISRIQGGLGSAQIRTNAAVEAKETMVSARMSSLLSKFNGKMALMRSDLEGQGLEIQGQRARAVGQDEMFQIFDAVELLGRKLEATAAKDGFVLDDNSSIGVSALASDLEEEGYLQARRAFARGRQEGADLDFAAQSARAEGRMADATAQFEAKQAVLTGRYQSKATRRKGAIEAMFYKGNKQLESMASRLEASQFGALAKQALVYGAQAEAAEAASASASKIGSLFSATSTILGGGASIAFELNKGKSSSYSGNTASALK